MANNIYYTIYLASQTRYPQAADVVSGWSGIGVSSGNETIADSGLFNLSFAVDATGLTALTNYKIAYVWYDGTNYSSVSIAEFTSGNPPSLIPVLSGVTIYDVTQTTGRARVTVTFT